MSDLTWSFDFDQKGVFPHFYFVLIFFFFFFYS